MMRFEYDSRGNVTSVSDGTASSSFDFDANNRLVTSRDGLGNATAFGYTIVACGCSEADQVTTIHTPDLPAGVQWTMTYGAQGRLASVTDPQDFTEHYTYEPTGELRTLTDRKDRITTTTHYQLGRVLSIVDTLGRTHQRAYPVPASGVWAGASLAAGSPDAVGAATGRGAALRSGEYQIGQDAYDTEGFPAQVSFYRDATFALGYTHYFDVGQRLTLRVDRTSQASDSAIVPSLPGDPGTVAHERYGYEPSTSVPLLASVDSPAFGTVGGSDTAITRNLELDEINTNGFGAGVERPATYIYTRDVGGRVISHSNHFSTTELAGDPTAPQIAIETFGSEYVYRADGRLAEIHDADDGSASTVQPLIPGPSVTTTLGLGSVSYTYDARGLLATRSDGYRYTYDALGRNTQLEFPDHHLRVQVFDDLGRITSRCYQYPADASLDRCYGASYDPVGNPVTLTDPEGHDAFAYEALDRLTKVTRTDTGGAVVAVEDYAHNGLGALSVNAGVAVDHQRPRLAGGGNADAAVPATLGGLPVGLDAGGRVTSLDTLGFAWGPLGQLRRVDLPAPQMPVHFGFDASGRRVWTLGDAAINRGNEFYVYEGVHRIAVLTHEEAFPNGRGLYSFVYDGVDHPLRLARTTASSHDLPEPPATPTERLWGSSQDTLAFYELDLAGNVRRLRAPGGEDLGGYRYSAFGETLENTAGSEVALQPLRWKGMWRFQIGTTELYDARARMWSPRLGTFLSIDEYAFHDLKATLWGWPNQNPITWRDPSGHIGTGDSPSSDRAIGAHADWSDAAFQSTYNPIVEAGIGAFVLTRAPALAFLAFAGAEIESDKDLWKIPLIGGLPPGALSPSATQAAMFSAREELGAGASCKQLASALKANLGKGHRVVQLGPTSGTVLPTRPGIAPANNPWELHAAVQTPSGGVLDPTLQAEFPSVDAWQNHVVGNAPVSRSFSDPFPPGPYENLEIEGF